MSPQNQDQNRPNQPAPSRRPPDLEDYIDMMRRYRAWILGPMFAGVVIATVVAFLWRDTYVSTALMRIVPQTVSDKLVPAVLSTQMAERLQSMQTEIESRSILSEIILKPSLDLYKKERDKLPNEDLILQMKRDIRIQPLGDRSSGGARGTVFQLSFAYYDKYKAQAVVQELVTRFIEANRDYQKDRTTKTASFLNDQLKQARERMSELEQKLTKFQMENVGRLPEQVQANVSAQTNLQMQIMNLGQTMATAQQEKMLLEASLKTLQARQRAAGASIEQTVTTTPPLTAVRNEGLINLDKQIAEQRSALAAMQRMYGKNHPDVARQIATVDSLEMTRLTVLEKQDPSAVPSGPLVRTETNKEAKKTFDELNYEIEMQQAQITAKQVRIDETIRQRDVLSKQLAVYQKRLEEEPLSSQQYAALQGDLALAKADYEDKMKKVGTAETAHSLEEQRGGEQLEVLDSPSLPLIATEPNRGLWAGVGLFGGLALGLVMAAAKEVKDASLKTLKDVRAYTNLPILSSIPLLENALLLRRKRRLVWLAWSASVFVGLLLMSGSFYYHWSSI